MLKCCQMCNNGLAWHFEELNNGYIEVEFRVVRQSKQCTDSMLKSKDFPDFPKRTIFIRISG